MVRAVIRSARTFGDHIDPSTTALIVVDTQNDFCDPAGAYGRLGADLGDMPAMAENVARLVDAARASRAFIVWIRATYDTIVQGAPLAERLNRRPGYGMGPCLEGSFGAEWYGRAQPRDADNEVVVTKHRNSAFWDTPIDLYLRSNGITTVVLTGTATSGCVDSNARDAFFRDYFIVLAADACASYSRARHEAALAKLGHSYGEVVPSSAVIDAWARSAAGPRRWESPSKIREIPSDETGLTDPKRSALLIVNLQHGVRCPGLEAVVPRVAALAAAARAAGVLVIHLHTQTRPQSDSPAWLERVRRHDLKTALLQPDSAAAAPIAESQPLPGDLIVVKHRESGFADTRLGTLLRANVIRTTVIAGTATEIDIDTTARDAAGRDYHAVIVRDAVAGDPAHHDAALAILESRFARLATSDALVSRWTSHTAEPAPGIHLGSH